MAEPKLTVELIPRNNWFKNLRSELSSEEWDKIRKHCYMEANYLCEICGGRGQDWPVECHEVWQYNDSINEQRLIGVIALCPSCHEVKHIGFAVNTGRIKEATEHLMKINNWNLEQVERHIQEIASKYKIRNMQNWSLDISIAYEWLKEL